MRLATVVSGPGRPHQRGFLIFPKHQGDILQNGFVLIAKTRRGTRFHDLSARRARFRPAAAPARTKLHEPASSVFDMIEVIPKLREFEQRAHRFPTDMIMVKRNKGAAEYFPRCKAARQRQARSPGWDESRIRAGRWQNTFCYTISK